MFICTVQKKFNGHRVSTNEKKRDAHRVYFCFDASWLGQKTVRFFSFYIQFALDLANICEKPKVWTLCPLVMQLRWRTLIWLREEFFSVRCHTVFKKNSSNNKRTILVYVLSNFLLHWCWIFTCLFDCSYTKHAGLLGENTAFGLAGVAVLRGQKHDCTILWNWSLKRLTTVI